MKPTVMTFGALVLAATLVGLKPPARAQPTDSGSQADLPAISKECGLQPGSSVELAPLPNSMRALKERKLIKIVAIGAPSVASGALEGTDNQQTLRDALERSVKGLSVEIINRGVSGELARDAAERLKNEVALNKPDMVLWQVGTSDAFARIPVTEFEVTLTDAIRWLKQRNVDVVLVGAKYSRPLARDPEYQDIRRSVFKVAGQENAPRVSHWQAAEAIERARGGPAAHINELKLSEESYDCVAQYVARAVISILFARKTKSGP